MTVNLHVLKASGSLISLEAVIRRSFSEGLAIVKSRLDLPDVDVVIDDDAAAAIPETGVGGYAPSAHTLYIHIDSESLDIKERICSELKSTLAHELHHCVRWAKTGYGKTLLEAVISEGLADHFDIEVNGGDPKPWSIAFNDVEVSEILKKAVTEFNNEAYDHAAWFFGSAEKNIPRWAGYSLGFHLVQKYIQRTGKTASELVNEKAQEFLPLSE